MPRHGRSGFSCIRTPTRRTLSHCASSGGQRRSQQQPGFRQEEQQASKFGSAAGAPCLVAGL
eukprot:527509-Alexandrium_andersonii.AAC.1